MPNRSVKWQALMVIVLVFVSVFSAIYANRFLENQEKNQIEFNQKRLAQKAVEAIMPTVEAQSPQRFQVQQSDENKMKICDTQNGNTISIVYKNGYNFEISTKNPCQKNPQ